MINPLAFCCPICGNSDIHSIGMLNGKPYCRKCIAFKGEEAEMKHMCSKKAFIQIDYELSPEQKVLSYKMLSNFKNGIDSLIYAVTGSGKTEICLQTMKYCIDNDLRVGFAVPRRTVCAELCDRFKHHFPNNKVIAVYGGHHKTIEGDIVCLTTHQLFRYKNYYDLLILDEIDAFPYRGNEVLHHLFNKSIKGHYALLTATPTNELLKEYQRPGKDVLRLAVRFHRHPLPVPKLICGGKLYLYYKLLKQIRHFLKNKKQIFIFVPTVDESKKLSFFLNLIFHSGTYINSKRKNNDLIIEEFRKKRYMYLVTTAVLERGVTVKDLQVIVFNTDHKIYDSAALIQIAGRAGRKIDAPEGEVIFFAKRNNEEIQRSIDDINSNNQILQDMLQRNKNG